MKIGALNCGHMAIRRPVNPQLLGALMALDCDLLLLNEFVETAEWVAALESRWGSVLRSPVRPFNARGRWCNQVVALSQHSLEALAGPAPVPTQDAMTNALRVRCLGMEVMGIRAPAYPKAADWYAYWSALELRGDVVIGDLNVDPGRGGKRDRVLPQGWQVVTPVGFSFESQRQSGKRSAIDHALVRPGLAVQRAAYVAGLLGRWGLDHAPICVEVSVPPCPRTDGKLSPG